MTLPVFVSEGDTFSLETLKREKEHPNWYRGVGKMKALPREGA